MRPLTFAEMERVAGGYWHSYCYSSTGGGTVWDREWIDDPTPPSGGGTPSDPTSGGSGDYPVEFLIYNPETDSSSWNAAEPDVPREPDIDYTSAGGPGWLSSLAEGGSWVSAQEQQNLNDAARDIAMHASSQASATAAVAALYADHGLGSFVSGTIDHSYNQSNGYLGSNSGDVVVNGQLYDVPILSTFNTTLQANLLAATWSDFSSLTTPDGTHSTLMSADEKQHAIDLLRNDGKFKDFHLNGVDITSEILKAISTDSIVFTDQYGVGAAQTRATTGQIFLSSSYKDDPVGTALVLAHEGLHQALFNVFGVHPDSVYEEALGKLVSAYALSGLSSQDLASFHADASVFNDFNQVKRLSDQGNFAGIMQYIKPSYSYLPDYPLTNALDPIKGSF